MASRVFKIYPPSQWLLAALTFFLGAGIARYLGYPIHAVILGMGLIGMLALQGAAFLLAEYFRLPMAPTVDGETPRQRVRFRLLLLQVSYTALTLSGISFLILLLARSLNLAAGILYLVSVIGVLCYAVPPAGLAESGFGEFVLAVFLGTLAPGMGFLLQTGTLHRLLSFTTLPLTLLSLACLLAWDFPRFAADVRYGRATLLTRLTWQRAVPIHHLLILFAFLSFSSAAFFNIPWSIIWPVLLALPFAVVQVIWLQRIANGGRTLWSFLSALALATVGLAAYLLAMTFWMR